MKRGALTTMARFEGTSRRLVAIIAAGVLLLLVALGYLLLQGNRQLEAEEQAYDKWVSGFAAGLGDRPAVVIVEPDALAELNSCTGSAERQARLQMLSYAVRALQTRKDQVYLDAGHSSWVPAGQMAGRLRAADIARAYGFSLNVSNYDPTSREVAYAAELDRDLGMRKRFVVTPAATGSAARADTATWPPRRSRALRLAPAGARWQGGSSSTRTRRRPNGFGLIQATPGRDRSGIA
jgi:cellulase/cellobiase CelA1